MTYKTTVFLLLSTTIFSVNGQQDPDNPMRRPLLYTPTREQYHVAVEKARKETGDIKPKNKVCVFCKDIQSNEDEKNFLITRFKHNVVFLALFPYQRGHILIIPNAHVQDLESLNQETRDELMAIICECSKIFEQFLNADGTNIGINIGVASGASKPDHLHIQALPRYAADYQTYMHLLAETRLVHWDMKKVYWELKPAFDDLRNQLHPNLQSK